MKTSKTLIIIAIFLILACASKLEEHKVGQVDTPVNIGILNFTVVRIDNDGKPVQFDWKGYNIKTGDAFHVPYEVIKLSNGNESYTISDENAGNNELSVNGKLYRFDASKQELVIKFGSGVSIDVGGDYQTAIKIYDKIENVEQQL